MNFIRVKHNIEVAHRLYRMEGNKCQNIHGHSMWVTLTIHGQLDDNGVLGGLEFGEVKKKFRSFLDEEFDHHLLLNRADPFAGTVQTTPRTQTDDYGDPVNLPGLLICADDPTTENLAKWIGQWAQQTFGNADIRHFDVLVDETHVNSAGWSM